MTQYRIPAKSSKYYVERELYMTVVHFCRQYPTWIAELNIDPDTSRAITYDKECVQTSMTGDMTADLAIRRVKIAEKVKLIDDTAKEVAGSCNSWLILGVCYGIPFFQLVSQGIPCGKDMYYSMRRKFYYLVSKRI